MFSLEECSYNHLLEFGDRGKLAKCHNTNELASVWSTTSKLEETGTVDWLR